MKKQTYLWNLLKKFNLQAVLGTITNIYFLYILTNNEFAFFSFFFQSERGIFPQTEIVFDLELPKDFVPSNNDGEVDEFCLVPASQLVEKICDPQMKTTSCPVTLDFLIRKGILTHDIGI